MPERDILPPAGPFRLPEWARQGAEAFPGRPSPGGGPLPPLPPQAAQAAQAARPTAAPAPAGGSVPTIGQGLEFLGIVPAPFIDMPGLQGVFGKELPAELGPKLPPGFTDQLVEATPTGK